MCILLWYTPLPSTDNQTMKQLLTFHITKIRILFQLYNRSMKIIIFFFINIYKIKNPLLVIDPVRWSFWDRGVKNSVMILYVSYRSFFYLMITIVWIGLVSVLAKELTLVVCDLPLSLMVEIHLVLLTPSIYTSIDWPFC